MEPGVVQEQPRLLEGQEDPVPLLVTSSSSPDEVVAGVSAIGPPPIDHREQQDLLHCIVRNVGLQAEEVVEAEDTMVEFLPQKGLPRWRCH